MKKKLLTFITVLSMCCLVACGGEKQDDMSTANKEEAVIGDAANEPTTKPVVETTPAPTAEPSSEVTEATAEPEPTAEPVAATPEPTTKPSIVYEGIDMESTLPGQEWLETFVGVIDEPKVVVFNDTTGKKVIVEQEGEVVVNPDEDAIALFFPEGYTDGNLSKGIKYSETKGGYQTEYYFIFYLDAEEMRAKTEWNAAFMTMHGEEKHPLYIKIIIE